MRNMIFLILGDLIMTSVLFHRLSVFADVLRKSPPLAVFSRSLLSRSWETVLPLNCAIFSRMPKASFVRFTASSQLDDSGTQQKVRARRASRQTPVTKSPLQLRIR
uniref:Putative secreted protein n=1 Tax=Ixodes ricinus TaxID=34613 RepID=A0A6B0UGJ5_IXORI